jgi:hypothetical protein
MIQFHTIPKDFKTIEFRDIEASVGCELSWYKGDQGSCHLEFSVVSALDY